MSFSILTDWWCIRKVFIYLFLFYLRLNGKRVSHFYYLYYYISNSYQMKTISLMLELFCCRRINHSNVNTRRFCHVRPCSDDTLRGSVFCPAHKPPLIIVHVALNRAVWQVTGETRSCFQGQCCNLQVKSRNSTPVCGAVTCLQCPYINMTRSLLICKQPFSAFHCISAQLVCVDPVHMLPAEGLGPVPGLSASEQGPQC